MRIHLIMIVLNGNLWYSIISGRLKSSYGKQEASRKPFEMLCRNKTKILSLYLVYPHYFRYNKRKAHTGEKYEFSGIFTGKGI